METDNSKVVDLMQKYYELKEFFESKLKNNEITSQLLLKGLYPLKKKIEGEMELTSADSLHHKTDIEILVDNGEVNAFVAEYNVENMYDDFPFKNGSDYISKIVQELENYKISTTYEY